MEKVAEAPTPTSFKLKPLPPGPGAVAMTARLARRRRNLARFCRELSAEYGGLVRLNFGLGAIYLVGRHDYAEYVLRERADHFGKGGKFWAGARPVFGNGLALSEGELWLRQRRLLQPLFSRQRHAALCAMMTTALSEQLTGWATLATGRPFDIKAQIFSLSMRLLLGTIFNTDVQPEELAAVEHSAHTLWNTVHYITYGAMLPQWVVLPGARRCLSALRVVDRFIFKTIAERRRGATTREPGTEDILSQLLNARSDDSRTGMSDQQIRDEAITMILAGYEITATAITWAVYQLGRCPHVERKLREELQRVLGGRVPTFADLGQLPYIKKFISETLRFHSPGWMTFRSATVEEELGGYRIPAGAVVGVSIDAIHHDPAVWSRPDEFDPERFAPEALAAQPRSAFIPFGIGAHMCIGNNFAMVEMTLVLIMLLQRYRIRLASSVPIEPQPESVQKPRGAVLVCMEPL